MDRDFRDQGRPDTGEAGSGRLEVDVGDYLEDWPFLESGFQEIRSLGGRSFRWTGGRATVRVPQGARQIALRVGAFRPPGLPPTWLRLGVEGGPIRKPTLLPREGFLTLRLTLPQAAAGAGESMPVYLETDPFTPGPWLPEDDDRVLGVQVDRLSFFLGEGRGISFD